MAMAPAIIVSSIIVHSHWPPSLSGRRQPPEDIVVNKGQCVTDISFEMSSTVVVCCPSLNVKVMNTS